MIDIFTKGSCLNFHLILKSIYPEAELYYNNSHVITKIDNCFYDITGRISGKGYIKEIPRKSISHILRYEYMFK